MQILQFWLTRHGQTEENVKRILCGQQGGTLTQLGIKQAEALGKRLSNQVFDFTYVSDLNRTKQTYEGIKKYANFPSKVTFTPILREKHAGILDGQSLDVPKQLAAQQAIPIRKFRPEKGEAWVDVFERAKEFLTMIIENHLLKEKSQPTLQNETETPQKQVQQLQVQGQNAQKMQLQLKISNSTLKHKNHV